MAKEVISRCDECGTSEGVEEITITYRGRTREVDACPEHGGPAIALFELGTDKPSTPPARTSGGRSAHAVVPIEDWNPALLKTSAEPTKAPENVEVPEGRPDAEAALIEAARPLIGTTELSAKVVVALADLIRAVEAGKGEEQARAAVLALNPQRIKVPNDAEGQRFREALAAYVAHHQGDE
ncbi:hypothetical protein ACIQZO_23020 [Streptomyces sp. NPDC097617]|uniref:hypothetical protein n=1 Tax=Streptomyces sp. NPDC097617 TaxID=3366091 RepID=UPI00380C0408